MGIKAKEKPVDRAMPLVDHLAELRSRILQVLAAFAVVVCFCVFFPSLTHPVIQDAIQFLAARFLPTGMKLVFTNPLDPLKVCLMASFFIGLIVVSPFFLVQAYLFLAPGLAKKHRRFLAWLALGSVFFLGLGVAATYCLFLPVTLNFFLNYGTGMGLVPMITLYDFYKMVLMIFLIFSLPFELPMAMGILGRLNIVRPETLRKKRRAAYLGLCIFAGVVTPDPTPVSQILLTIPLWVLFEAGLLFAGAVARPD